MTKRRREGAFAGLTRSTVLLAFASLFADVSTEMLYPVLPTFMTQVLKASGGVVGLMEGAAVATQNIVQGFSGSLADRLRRHKRVAVVGFAVAALSKPLIGFATAWPAAVGARLLDRFGTGIRSAPRDALVAGSADAAHRGKAFGLEGAGDNAGAFLGPVLAVLLLTAAGLGVRPLFFLAVVPGLLAVLMVLLVKERRAQAPAKASLQAGLGRFPRRYLVYLGAVAIFSLGNSSNAFLILQTQSLGVSLPNTILIYAGYNLVAALASYPVGALSDRIGRRLLLALAVSVFALSYLAFALSRSVTVVAAAFVLYGLFQGGFRAMGKTLASELSPTSLQASGLGWYGTVVGLAGLAASVIAGQLWDRVGHAAVFWYGAAFAALGVLATLALVREPQRDAEPAA